MTAAILAENVKMRRSQTVATDKMKIRDAVDADLTALIEIYNAAVATRIAKLR